jgi:hypothetical protein
MAPEMRAIYTRYTKHKLIDYDTIHAVDLWEELSDCSDESQSTKKVVQWAEEIS